MIVLWISIVVVGLGVAIVASNRAVEYASELAFTFNVPPFVIGAIVVAIGTDLPEIANAVVSAISGYGDLAAGTATGSTITQMTLVLGILPFVAGTMATGRHRIVLPGALMVGGLLIGALFGRDDVLGRAEGLILVAFWLVSAVLVYRQTPTAGAPAMVAPSRKPARSVTGVMVALSLVGAGAAAAVAAFIEIAEMLNVPVFLLGFFATAIGTSLPELVVDVVAVRRGEKDMAVGDIFGSSLIDATLALGIGPALIPFAVDGSLVVRSAMAGAVIVALVTLVLARRGRHDRLTGVLLIGAYACLYPVLLV
jgi:cation:H+ antiporter